LLVTPSLTYMADAVSSAGVDSFGVAYGIYNVAWALGLLAGPASGGYLFERMGFLRLSIVWAAAIVGITLLLTRAARVGRSTGAV
jgi:MFS family permease